MPKRSSTEKSGTGSARRQAKKESRQASHEAYEIELVHRSVLKNAPYNPRTITDKSRKKLRDNIARVGLLEPPIWNARTGNLVGGHQRLSIMDALEGTHDYMIRVAKVDLDEKTEKAQNIFMNNPEAQGDFDMPKLEELIGSKSDIQVTDTGFDLEDIMAITGDKSVFGESEEMTALAEKMRALKERHKKIAAGITESGEDDPNFYLVAVFRDMAHRKEFLDHFGGSDGQWFIDGRRLLDLLNKPVSPKKPAKVRKT